MKDLTKTLKSVTAMILLVLFSASTIVSCDAKKQAEGNEDETEQATEAAETADEAETSDEHPTDGGEHPSGEHPSGDESEADSTATE